MAKTNKYNDNILVAECFKKKALWFAKYLREYKFVVRYVKFQQYSANIFIGNDRDLNEFITIYYKPSANRYSLRLTRVFDEDEARHIQHLWDCNIGTYGKLVIPIFL